MLKKTVEVGKGVPIRLMGTKAQRPGRPQQVRGTRKWWVCEGQAEPSEGKPSKGRLSEGKLQWQEQYDHKYRIK